MDNNNRRPSLPNGDTSDWRTQLQPPDLRQKIVNKIMETLKKHLHFSGPAGIKELSRIATGIEKEIFSDAVNQTDYLRKISMKMLTMETKSQNAAGSSSSITDANNGAFMDSIPTNQGLHLAGSLPTNQTQASQLLLSQTKQMLKSQVGNSSLQNNQQGVHILSQPTGGLQRTHQAGQGLFSSQSQHSQNQPSQQQMMPQLQSHHQQLALQQQPNLLHKDVQQRLQTSGQVTASLLPPQNVVDQQRQLYQTQRTLPEMPSSSLDSTAQTESGNGGDWREEIYENVKSMKEMYLLDLKEFYHKIVAKLQQLDPIPQQQRSDQFEKLKQVKGMLERCISFMSLPKSNISPEVKDKLGPYEKQIRNFLNMHKPRTAVQLRQLPQSQTQPMQQPQPQTVQDQSHDNQTHPQMQSMSMQGTGPRAQQHSLPNMQNNLLSSRPGVSASQQTISSSVPASSLETGQGNALNNSQQVAMGSMQQSTSQQVNNSSASAQSGLSTLQSNINQPQLSSSLVQHQHLKQMIGQRTVGDMQQQKKQRLLNQQNNIINIQQQQLQQQKQQPQHQLISQQNGLQATHQQQLGTQSNGTGLQQPQQQMLNSQVGNSSLQNNQHGEHILSQPTGGLQRTHQAGQGLFFSKIQHSQNQPSQQQMMPQLQSHQQLGLQQQPNLLHQDVQQRLQASGQVPPQNVVDQQRQLYQTQRTLPEMPSSSLDSTSQTGSGNGGDWREEIYQKVKSMKEMYLPDLKEFYHKIVAKLQQLDPIPQQQRSDQYEKLKQVKGMLERCISFMSLPKSNISPEVKDKLGPYEKQIRNFLNMHKPRTAVQLRQLPQSQTQPMQQPQPQTVQDQSHDNQTHPQMQSMSMQGTGPRAQQHSNN